MFTKDQILEIFKTSRSKAEVMRKTGLHNNGAGIRKISKWIKEYYIDISHFDGGLVQYKRIIKICPVCNNKFRTKKDHSREKIVCSRACSNTYFRSGKDNGNYKYGGWSKNGKKYRIRSPHRHICFQYWEYKCAVCNWDKVVEVHHIDEDNKNNDPKNLIPLCSNHHRLTVTKQYKDEINSLIDKIVKQKWS